MIFEERVKKELHPLDAYSVLLDTRTANKAPEKEEISGSSGMGSFISVRTRKHLWRGCAFQADGHDVSASRIRSVAKELTTGYVQITTRANLQMRLIQPKDAPEVLRRIQAVGLHTRGAGADNIRNITANPTPGDDPLELST